MEITCRGIGRHQSFSIARLRVKNVLPQQSPDDDYNCGIGVVATIGIILRDVIGFNPEEDIKFGTIFAKNKMLVACCSSSKEQEQQQLGHHGGQRAAHEPKPAAHCDAAAG